MHRDTCREKQKGESRVPIRSASCGTPCRNDKPGISMRRQQVGVKQAVAGEKAPYSTKDLNMI